MAYGKDPKVLDEIPSFRQSSALEESLRPKRGGGGGGGVRPYYFDTFKPSHDQPDTIRVIQGKYDCLIGTQDGELVMQPGLSYYSYIEHYHATARRSIICSAGPFGAFKGKAEPCYGHEMFWADKSAGKKNGPMSMSEKKSFSVLHYATYARTEQIGPDGKEKRNSEGEPYMEWVRVLDHERNLPKYASKEKVEARMLHWDMNYSHWNTLLDYAKEIGKSCVSCQSRDTVSWDAWVCENCGEALIEKLTTTLSPKEIDEITLSKVRCGKCTHVGYLQEILSCSSCPKGKRAEIFDVDMYVKVVADPTGRSKATTLAITGWSNPRPVDARFADIAKPLDLPKIFTPTPYEKQLQIFGAAPSDTSTRQPVTVHTQGYVPRTLGGK